MRLLRLFTRLLGWLLTPLVAWAASFVGAWIGALIATVIGGPTAGIWIVMMAGAAAAVGAILVWMRLLRTVPELREVLDVTERGAPRALDPEAAATPEETGETG